MSLRSPLGRVLGLGSARGGSAHWYHQRLSAVALALLAIWFFVALLGLEGGGHAAVVEWLRSPLSATLAALLVAVLAWHATLGLQVVLEDYVSHKGWRLALTVFLKFLYAFAAVAGVLAVLRIGFGANG